MRSALTIAALICLVEMGWAIPRNTQCGVVGTWQPATRSGQTTTTYRRAGPLRDEDAGTNHFSYPDGNTNPEIYVNVPHHRCLQESIIWSRTGGCPSVSDGGSVYKTCVPEGHNPNVVGYHSGGAEGSFGKCPSNTCPGFYAGGRGPSNWEVHCWGCHHNQRDEGNFGSTKGTEAAYSWNGDWGSGGAGWCQNKVWYWHAYYSHRSMFRRGDCWWNVAATTGYPCTARKATECCGCRIDPELTSSGVPKGAQGDTHVYYRAVYVILKCDTTWQRGVNGASGSMRYSDSGAQPSCVAKDMASDTCRGAGKVFIARQGEHYHGVSMTKYEGVSTPESLRRTYNPDAPEFCSDCPAGKSSPSNTLSTNCENCGEGKYSEITSCEDCPAGWYSEGNDAHAECTRCPAGQHQNGEGHGSCKNCKNGKYSNQETQVSCKNCRAGSYTTTTNAPNANCQICGKGKYQSENGQNSCTECPPAKYIAPDVGIYHPWVHGASNVYRGKHNQLSDCANCPAEDGYRTNKAEAGGSLEGSWACEAW